MMRGRVAGARVHTPSLAGATPAPATIIRPGLSRRALLAGLFGGAAYAATKSFAFFDSASCPRNSLRTAALRMTLNGAPEAAWQLVDADSGEVLGEIPGVWEKRDGLWLAS